MKHIDLSSLPIALIVILAVVLVFQVGLAIIALIDLHKRPVAQLVFSNKWIWVAIILFANLLGPILYFVAGRKTPVISDQAAAPSNQSGTIADILYGPRDDAK